MDEDDDDYEVFDCGHCGSGITNEEYNRTGTDDYCESCPEICTDPRSVTFGHHTDECGGKCTQEGAP